VPDLRAFWWGDDHGAQFSEAREFTGSTRGNSLTVNKFGTVRNGHNSVTYYLDVVLK